MILVCEIMFDRGAHVPFNAGFLATIRAAFPREELTFYGGAAHLEQLKKQLGQPLASSILWSEILPVPPGPSYAERFFRELKIVRYLLASLPSSPTSRLILTSAFPSTVLAIKVARILQPNGPQVQMVLHELSGISGKRRRHPVYRVQDMNTSLRLLGNRGIQYLVLEESIRDGVVDCLPRLLGKIECLDHPISPNEGTNDLLDFQEPIRFGFLGTALKSKGYPLFVETANTIITKYSRRAEFHVIGRCPEESKHVRGIEALATQPSVTPLSREDFIRGITPLHFIVLPYAASRYALAASGVLLDAVAWKKPILSRRIATFETMFRRHGDIGYLFDKDSEVSRIIEQILQDPDPSRYRRQALAIGEIRKAREPEALAVAYRELCGKCDGK